LELNFAYALAITGGVIKSIHIIFAAVTYAFMKMTNVQHTFSKNKIVHSVIVVIIAEVLFVGLGVAAVLSVSFDPTFREGTFYSSDPFRRIKYVFLLLLYFTNASLLWSIYPKKRNNSRFKTGIGILKPSTDDAPDLEPGPVEMETKNFNEDSQHILV
jgi:hypothetical protein